MSHFLGANDRHDQVTATDCGREDQCTVGDGFLDGTEDLRLFEDNIRAARGRSCFRIRPAVAWRDEAHFRQTEIEHCTSRFADVLAKLGTNENDDGFGGRAHSNLS